MATATAYPQFQQKVGTKLVNESSDTFKVLLLTAYTYANTHATLTDVLGAGTEVAAGSGYTTGGVTLGSVTFTTTGATTKLAAGNVTGLTAVTCRYIVVADTQGGSNATSYPVCYVDLGSSQSISGITWNASGIITWA